jgi:hypothetical protein
VEAGDQHDRRLNEEVDRERDEGGRDHPQRAALSARASARQLPEHDGAGADLDQRVEPEPGQRNRSRPHRGDREHGDTDDVPAEGRCFEQAPTAKQTSGVAAVMSVLIIASIRFHD